MTTQLFRNIHYQEFYYIGRQILIKAEDRRFFIEIVVKSVRDAISSHNEVFLDIFHNTMKEAIHGFPVDQGGPAYYNIPDPST